MTTYYFAEVQCSVCGTTAEHQCWGTTNFFGSYDLDTRPPEMQRSTITAWVQRCPQCGYCADSVDESGPKTQAVVASDEYKQQLSDPAFPELANSFLCEAMINTANGDFESATWSFIHAAWACDDADHPTQAAACRGKAAEMLRRAEDDYPLVSDYETNTALLVDLLRRAAEFDDARVVLAARKEKITDENMVKILKFQAFLIKQGDSSCHTVAEAHSADA